MKELSDFLDDYTTPENKELYLRTFNTLTASGNAEVTMELGFIFSNYTAYPVEETLLKIYNCLINQSMDSIRNYGVIVSRGFSLSGLESFLSALQTLPNYSDHESLSTVLAMETTDVEKIGRIAELINDCDLAESTINIEYVLPDIFDNLEGLVDTLVTESETDGEVEPEITTGPVKHIKDFITDHSPEILKELIDEGFKPNTPLPILLEQVEYELENLNERPDELSMELLGVVIYSNTPVLDVSDTVSDLIDDFANDVNTSIKASEYLAKAEIGKYYEQ